MTDQTTQNLSAKEQLALIRKNRRAFRRRGATFQTVAVLEAYFSLRDKKPRATVADTARVLGLDPSQVRRHFLRAEAMQMVVRVGRTYYLFAKMVLDTAAKAVWERVQHMREKARRRLNALQTGAKSGFQDKVSLHIGQVNPLGFQEPETEQMTRSEALKALKKAYVPVHLRKHKC